MSYDEYSKLLIWSYKQGFADAGKLIRDTEGTIDEEKMAKQFHGILSNLRKKEEEAEEAQARQGVVDSSTDVATE